jgi:hypothetical protein
MNEEDVEESVRHARKCSGSFHLSEDKPNLELYEFVKGDRQMVFQRPILNAKSLIVLSLAAVPLVLVAWAVRIPVQGSDLAVAILLGAPIGIWLLWLALSWLFTKDILLIDRDSRLLVAARRTPLRLKGNKYSFDQVSALWVRHERGPEEDSIPGYWRTFVAMKDTSPVYLGPGTKADVTRLAVQIAGALGVQVLEFPIDGPPRVLGPSAAGS